MVVAALVGIAVWWPLGDPAIDREVLGYGDRVDATVTAAEIGPCGFDPSVECDSVSARIASGPDEGTFATLEADVVTRIPGAELAVGDDIVLTDAGPDVDPAGRYSFADVQRRWPLVVLAVVFGVAVVALGRLRGLLALAGIGITVGVLLAFVFPALLRGASPLGVGPHRCHRHRRQHHLPRPRCQRPHHRGPRRHDREPAADRRAGRRLRGRRPPLRPGVGGVAQPVDLRPRPRKS